MGPDEICGLHASESPAFKLKPFVSEVFKLKFEELPDYDRLRFLLQKSLLNENCVPGKEFDWIPTDERKRLNSLN